ncbi:hypothetical protein ACH5RR_023212 [Cinchona calisaya]|uniref:RNase H type-1 domain-containing protein n=1 Tax=Cinchona calisaya TaxID=153742 RepID=A0ABD2ZDB5_9GENT
MKNSSNLERSEGSKCETVSAVIQEISSLYSDLFSASHPSIFDEVLDEIPTYMDQQSHPNSSRVSDKEKEFIPSYPQVVEPAPVAARESGFSPQSLTIQADSLLNLNWQPYLERVEIHSKKQHNIGLEHFGIPLIQPSSPDTNRILLDNSCMEELSMISAISFVTNQLKDDNQTKLRPPKEAMQKILKGQSDGTLSIPNIIVQLACNRRKDFDLLMQFGKELNAKYNNPTNLVEASLGMVVFFEIIMANLSSGAGRVPWLLDATICRIKDLLHLRAFHFNHTFREANCVADKLTKLGSHDIHCNLHFSSHNSPSCIRGLLNLDPIGFPYVQTKHNAST